jgi:hypothetical protein
VRRKKENEQTEKRDLEGGTKEGRTNAPIKTGVEQKKTGVESRDLRLT